MTVISNCVQGNLACARAAELLAVTPRHVKRLKARYRQGSAAALAHASRGRPSHRRLPQRVRDRILHLARTRYAGFNDHHLCEKLTEQEGFSLSRETLRRLLRSQGLGSPRKRRPPAHRQRRLRSAREGELVQLDGSPHDWLEGRGPRLTALGMQDDASGKILAAQFFPAETAEGYFHLLQRLLPRFGVPVAFYGDRSGIFVRNDDHWTVEEELAGQRQPTQFGRALASTRHHLHRRAISPSQGPRRTSLGRAARSPDQRTPPGPAPAIWTPPTASCSNLSPTTIAASLALPREAAKAWRPAPDDLHRICASGMHASSATITSCSGTGSRFQIPPQHRRFSFAGANIQLYQALDGEISLYYGETRRNIPHQQGDIFMLPLG